MNKGDKVFFYPTDRETGEPLTKNYFWGSEAEVVKDSANGIETIRFKHITATVEVPTSELSYGKR